MDKALRSMADDFYLTSSNTTWNKAHNPEQYVKLAFERHGVPVYLERRPALFPVTDGRCEDGQSFCAVQMAKDCRPQASKVKVCTEKYMRV